VFRGRKTGVYNSWEVCNEYILDFSGAAYQSYLTMMEAEKAYAAFLEHQNKDRKSEHVVNMWSWKDCVILVQFVVIIILWYQMI
jgi:viroplasmin and RNaseH domain-containing protein